MVLRWGWPDAAAPSAGRTRNGKFADSFGETAASAVEQGEGPYADFNASVAKATREVYEGPLARLGGDPDAVARVVERAIDRRRRRSACG